jgi:hypothetical protein
MQDEGLDLDYDLTLDCFMDYEASDDEKNSVICSQKVNSFLYFFKWTFRIPTVNTKNFEKKVLEKFDRKNSKFRILRGRVGQVIVLFQTISDLILSYNQVKSTGRLLGISVQRFSLFSSHRPIKWFSYIVKFKDLVSHDLKMELAGKFISFFHGNFSLDISSDQIFLFDRRWLNQINYSVKPTKFAVLIDDFS